MVGDGLEILRAEAWIFLPKLLHGGPESVDYLGLTLLFGGLEELGLSIGVLPAYLVQFTLDALGVAEVLDASQVVWIEPGGQGVGVWGLGLRRWSLSKHRRADSGGGIGVVLDPAVQFEKGLNLCLRKDFLANPKVSRGKGIFQVTATCVVVVDAITARISCQSF